MSGPCAVIDILRCSRPTFILMAGVLRFVALLECAWMSSNEEHLGSSLNLELPLETDTLPTKASRS